MSKLTNITHPNASLGVAELIDAAENAMPALVVAMQDARKRGEFDYASELDRRWSAINSVLNRIKGGAS